MIIDTTYLLPLSKIGIDTDLLKIVVMEDNVPLGDIGVSLISLFELQAKAVKLNVSPRHVIEAVDVINTVFRVEPFYNPKIIEIADRLSRKLDYMDSLILGTAVVLKEDLVTEDSKIKGMKKEIMQDFGINVLSYKNFKR